MMDRLVPAYNACKVCDSVALDLQYVSAASALRILKCRGCGLVLIGQEFTTAEQAEYYGNQVHYTDFVNAENSVPEVESRQDGWLDIICEQLETSRPGLIGRLLEIGCGAGDFLAKARKRSFEVYGTEISSVAVQMAKDQFALDVRLGELTVEDWGESHFDALALIGVVEHVADPRQLLIQAWRLLRPGGILLIYTPRYCSYDWVAIATAKTLGGVFCRGMDRRVNQAHLQIFPQRTMNALLHSIGFHTLRSDAVCEYNLPVVEYLKSLGVTRPWILVFASSLVGSMIKRKLFFRNNMCVLARKSRLV